MNARRADVGGVHIGGVRARRAAVDGGSPTERRLTYLLPIRSTTPPGDELTAYLRMISRHCAVVVVDGSVAPVFEQAHDAWSRFATHLRPDPDLRCANGKVQGVLTGLSHVRTDAVVIADDDVRYTPRNLTDVLDGLDEADLVVPQNYFLPLPWHARWDSARSLFNRVTGGDFPGTLAVRVAPLRASGGYDGDVLFENLELIRTVRAVGGVCAARPDIFVRRLPPTTGHFVGQRVRQAYDEFARPWRLAAFLAVAPTAIVTARRRPFALALVAAGTVAIGEAGRRSNGGRTHFPVSTSWFTPLWLLERAVCAWAALWMRARGGVVYHGRRLPRAANAPGDLRRRVGSSTLSSTA